MEQRIREQAQMPKGNDRKRINVDLGSPTLYRALKFAAVERNVPARQIVVEALQEWLERNHLLTESAREREDGR